MSEFTKGHRFGKYRILRMLGQGGMADVYEAKDTEIGRVVALKVLPAAFARDQERAGRFAKEIRASAGLDHPNIVSVFEVGELDGLHYYTMSVLPGGDLKARLRKGALPEAEAVRITKEIAGALHYAQDKGFVHRDVKPENILFREDGSAVLTDFGIARATSSQTRMTATGLSIGTPHYMSPEQARGREVDSRSDLYALGVMFFEMLTGQVPFDAQDSLAVAYQHVNDSVPQLPSDLHSFQPILDRMLAKDPDDRYTDGRELLDDLDRLAQGESIEPASGATRVLKRAPAGDPEAAAQPEPAQAVRSSGGWKWALGGGALAAVVVAAGVYVWQDGASTVPVGGSNPVPRPAAAAADSAPASNRQSRENAEPGPQRAQEGSAIFAVTSEPSGAEVLLDGRSIGTTPFQGEKLPAGTFEITVRGRYHDPWTREVTLEDDVVTRLDAELERGIGRVTVITDPPGAEVWIDGAPRPDRTPLTVDDLAAGEEQVEIRLARYRTVTRTVEILPDDTARLDVELEGGDLHEWEGRWLTGADIVPLLLEAAEADLAATRLMAPEGENAWEKYQRILDIRENQPVALAGIERIAGRYVELAEAALADDELERAQAFLANAVTAGASGSAYDRAKNALQGAQAERRTEQQRRRLIEGIQTELSRLGREVRVTGTLDSATSEAITVFERATELPERGAATDALLARLQQSNRWPGLQAGDVFQDCPDCPEIVVIASDTFVMGSSSDEPQRDINEGPQQLPLIPYFALGKTEVTFEQWQACVADGGCDHRPDDEGWGEGDRPVINVSWNDAQEYVRWLSRKTGETYRLPSEAEWEYAARAGTNTRFHTGDCITTDQANFDGNNPPSGCPRGQSRQRTVPVASFAPNAFGLHDMHGNVWEWAQDCWNDGYRGAPSDGSAWMSGDCGRAVLRGGSWDSTGRYMRSAYRGGTTRGNRGSLHGFRVARSVTL